jgi:hypothetical protein
VSWQAAQLGSTWTERSANHGRYDRAVRRIWDVSPGYLNCVGGQDVMSRAA